MDILKNINSINERIHNACKRSGRASSDITLVAVTKTIAPEIINTAITSGIKHIGENRVQELCDKYRDINTGVSHHLIGHLQTNKVKLIVDKVELIHSLDSERLAQEIQNRSQEISKITNVLLQVNISGERSKFGISPNEVDNMLEFVGGLPNIALKGLMTIAPINSDENQTREIFKNLYKLFVDISKKKYNNIYMQYLSMGMSNDFEIAIEEGANIIRVGSAIFKA